MTCYFRHLQQIFKKAGIEVTSENKREIDKIIHNIVGVDYKNCPVTWREVKKRIAEDEEDFISKLKEAWGKRAQHRLDSTYVERK
jgi:type IV secretory pathway VirB4 component